MNSNVNYVLDWTLRMATKYGGIVRDTEGKIYDWGQALARECYGPNWVRVVPEAPTRSDILRATQWEGGDWPDWVEKPVT